jgi:hypothetical protein
VADMSLDELLSSSLKSAAEPAASAGVADVIRSRVAAGDTGTSVAGSTAPGWGGSAGGVMTIVAPMALIVVAGIAGGALGASGLLGLTPATSTGDIPTYVISPDTAPIYSCPGGPLIGAISANTRVLAVARDAEGAFLGARNPDDLTSTIWFATGDLILDAESPDPASLPIEECPEVTVTEVTPTPTPTPTQEPTDEPQPPSDTIAPKIGGGQWNPGAVLGAEALPYCSNTADITFSATDEVGVVSVTGVTSRPGSSVAQIGHSGNNWTFRFTGGNYASGPDIQVQVTFTAKDAAGNSSNLVRPITLGPASNCII